MRQYQMGTLLTLGVGLLVIGFAVRLVLALSWSLIPLANYAIGIGFILAIVGLFTSGRRR